MTIPTSGTNNSSQNRRLPPTSTGGKIREMVRNPLQFFQGIASQYGDIVCYRPAPEPAYLLNHPNYVRHVLVDNNRNYTKATSSNLLFKNVVADGLLTSEGETWRKQRRMMQPAFHHTRIEQLDGMIVEAAQSTLDVWQRAFESNKAIDISREMAALTLTVTTRALFGVDLGDEVREIGEIINRAANYLEKPSNPHMVQSRQDFGAVVDRIIQQRKQNFKDGGDLLSSMILARDEKTGTGMDDEQLRNQVMTLMLAGYETTATTLTWTWYLLSQNPAAMDRLRSEVRKTLNGRLPRYSDLENMPYTGMVLDESLRLFPPAWTLGRRAIGEDEIDGYYIPANTVIAICIYALHRHPAFWDQPDIFDPERFSPGNSAGRNKFAYIPFGAGPRQCIGNNFGLMEASLIMACILQRFELHLLPGTEVTPQAFYVLRPSRDMMMSLHPRVFRKNFVRG
jgi:enediyne biosynthesis protein E7